MAKHTALELISGYSKNGSDIGGKQLISVRITGSTNHVSVSKLTKAFSAIFTRLSSTLSCTSTKTYGALGTVFGGLVLVLSLLLSYAGFLPMPSLNVIAVSALLLGAGILLSCFDKPISLAFQDFKLTDFIFFEFFCIRRMHRNEKGRGLPAFVGVVVGIVLALLSVFWSFELVILLLGVLLYLFLTVLSPEFSFFSIFLAMPFLSAVEKNGVILAAMVGVTLASYARKVYLGKRVYCFEQYDVVLFTMLGFILLSGVFVKGAASFMSSVVMILLGAGGYILSSNLAANRRMADGLSNAVIVSSVPVAVIALTEAVSKLASSGFRAFSGVSATFDKPFILACFMIVSSAFALYLSSVRRSRLAKTLYFIVFILDLAVILLTMSFFAYVAVLVGFLTLLILKIKHASGVIIGILVILPSALFLLPEAELAEIASLSVVRALGISESVSHFSAVKQMLSDNLFMGVGTGEDAFISEILKYDPGFAASSSGSLFLGVACEAGIFSLIALIFILLVRSTHRTVYMPYIKQSQVSKLSSYSTVLLVTLLVYGGFNFIFADMTMYYLFWCVFGLGSATLRVSKQEYDDRVAYFADGSAEDQSSIDIAIK